MIIVCQILLNLWGADFPQFFIYKEHTKNIQKYSRDKGLFWALSNKTNSFTSCPFLPQAQQRSKRLRLYWPVTAASSKESVYNTSVVWLAAKHITMSKYTSRLSWQSHCNHFSKTGAKVCEMLITSYALAEGCFNFNDKITAQAIKQLTQPFIKVH